MNLYFKFLTLLCSTVILITLVQVFLIRYNMKSNLWLTGTNKIIVQEKLSQKNLSFTIEDPSVIKSFKRYFENTKTSYACGAYSRYYKITMINGKQKKVYGYSQGNELTDFGKSPGTLTLIVRVYKTDSSFEHFIMSIINEKHFDFSSIQKSM